MKLYKFKKYITWNLISLIGYIGCAFLAVFWMTFMLTVSNINVKPELNEYYFSYLIKHVLIPYAHLYKFQLSCVLILIISCLFEYKHYVIKGKYGFVIFENHQNIYNPIFVTGLFLNFLPIYTVFMYSMITLRKFL